MNTFHSTPHYACRYMPSSRGLGRPVDAFCRSFAMWRGFFVNPAGAVLRQGCKQCISAARTDEQHPGLLLTSQLRCISQEGSVADVYATRHVGSSAWRCIKEQFSSGWQPGAAVSGHARTRLMQQLNSGVLLLTLRDAAVVLCLIYIQN